MYAFESVSVFCHAVYRNMIMKWQLYAYLNNSYILRLLDEEEFSTEYFHSPIILIYMALKAKIKPLICACNLLVMKVSKMSATLKKIRLIYEKKSYLYLGKLN